MSRAKIGTHRETLADAFASHDLICSNSVYQGISVEKSNGSLKYLNDAGGDQELTGPLTFSSTTDMRIPPIVTTFLRRSPDSSATATDR